MQRVILAAAGIILASAIGPVVSADEVIDLGSRRELFVDDYLIDKIDGAELILHKPTPREMVILHDEPWEGNASGYHTMLQDGDIYRMYYRGHRYAAEEGRLRPVHLEVTCYAESHDGIHWTKPQLGLFDYEGSKQNNIIWQGTGSHNFTPFLDTNPSCASEQRYKAFGGTGSRGLHAFKSADGIHWSKLSDKPVFTEGAFDSQNVAFWDPARDRYAAYFRFFSKKSEGSLRQIGGTHSQDFLHWASPTPLNYPGSQQRQQMYTNQIVPYYRAPHILLGFPTRYVARGLTDHVQTLDPVAVRARVTAAGRRLGTDLTDGLFMTSRDGVTFKRWDQAFLRPGPQQEGRWMYGDNYQSWGLVETESNIPGGPRELSFYSSEGSWRDGETGERRYTIRLDGFVSLNAPLAGGEIVTPPLRFNGSNLVINYSTSAAGSLRIEIQDSNGQPVSGFALADCPELYGDSIDQVVSWEKGSDVSSLAGEALRLRIVMKDADLYSMQFRQSE